ncbi:MAG: hypothetical protein R3300_00995 [Candidatus Promineifilaceae bacterium]|nr:hypothetical protein [Candidatus Promineifilaceae bacterium]
MDIERTRPNRVEVSLHPYELAALIAAARWVLAGAEGHLSEEALDQLRRVIARYDAASQRHRPDIEKNESVKEKA